MKSISRILVVFLTGVCSLVTASGIVSLRGRVLDPNGGGIPNAYVELLDEQGRKVFIGGTNQAGEFFVSSLNPGRYVIQVYRNHFQHRTLAISVTHANQSITISLALSRQKYSITVSDRASTLDTATEAHQDALTFGSQQLNQLPVKDGDVLSALTFFTNPAGGQAPTIIVDGIEREDSVTLTPSMVQEVRLNTNEYSAEFPKPGKDRIEVTTNAGGDVLHGEVFFRARNSLFDARNPFASGKPPFARYGYEGALSGPLWRRKLYFFLSADREEQQQAAPVLAYLPTGLVSENVLAPLTQDLLTGRVDWNSSEVNRISVRYELHQDQASKMGVGGLILPEAGTDHFHHDYRWEFSDQYVFSPNLFNSFQVALGTNYEQFTSENNAPSIVVAGAFQAGGAQRDNWRKEPRAEFLESLSGVQGTLSIKAGLDARFHPFRNFNADNYGGTYQFSSLEDFLARQPMVYTVNAGNPLITGEQDDYDWYLQVEKHYQRLTWFAGVRHEFQTHFDHFGNLAPRLAIAWSPTQDKKTVIRLGGGIFYDRRPPVILQQVLRFNGMNTLSYVIENPPFPVVNPIALITMQPSTIFQLDPSMTFPRLYQTSATVEHQLSSGFVATAEYIYQRGEHLFRTRNINAPLPTTGLLPNPTEGDVDQIESSASSRGDIVNLTLKSPPNRRYQFMAQYTLSYLWDDTNDVFGPPPPGGMGPPPGAGWNNMFVLPANNYNLRPEWGPANNDIRHRFGLSGTVPLPWHLMLGTLTSLHSGLPYDITTGRDTDDDPYPNERPPGVTRNTARGAGYISIDVHLDRTFRLDFEGRKLDCDISVDSFNVTNHRNPSTYMGVITSPLFGQPVAGYNGREMQFSLHARF
jgi:hypothetical protein